MGQRGFTLIEVIVALGIFDVLGTIAALSMVQNLRTSLANQVRYEAIQAAQATLDKIRFEDVATLTGSRTESVVVGARTYTVAVTYCKIEEFCLSKDIRHIDLAVTYRDKHVYATDTVFTKFT